MAERIPFRGPIKDKIIPSDLNMFATQHYQKAAPLIADDYARACMSTQLRWDVLSIFHWIMTDFGMSKIVKSPWPGIEGSPEDQAMNGVLFLLRDGTQFQFADEMPNVEPELLARMNVVLKRWERHSEALREMRAVETRPIPIPPPPPPPEQPKPTPVPEAPKPTPTTPAEPYGWWDCPKCGADSNPPKTQRCMKCRAPRPGSVPEAPKPEAPKPPVQGKPEWKKTVLMLAGVLSAVGVAIKLFVPGWVDTIIDAIVALLRAIGG